MDKTRSEYTMDPDAHGMIREVELTGGPSRGIRVLELETTAGLRLDILVDRALDIGRVTFRDKPVSWNSPTGYRHPAYWNESDENGVSLMRGMSGLLVTGGLNHIFAPSSRDGSGYAYAPRFNEYVPLHGRISNTPAAEYRFGRDQDILFVEGITRQVAVFGEALELRRRIEVPRNGTVIRIIDEVTNIGFEENVHHMLYHVNLGWPLLSERTRFTAKVTDRPWATSNFVDQFALNDFPAPTPGDREQCAQFRIQSDEHGWKEVLATNEYEDLSFRLRWRADSLPEFVQWINGRSGSYAVGLEPCSHGAIELNEKTGLPHSLLPGESRNYELNLSFDKMEVKEDVSEENPVCNHRA